MDHLRAALPSLLRRGGVPERKLNEAYLAESLWSVSGTVNFGNQAGKFI
jgi:hypothetical protein